MPPSGWWHITLQVRGQSKRVKQLFQKNNKCLITCSCIYSCGKCFVHVYPCVSAWERVALQSGARVCFCVCMCVFQRVCVQIMYCCSCPLIWQYNLSFALACCNLPIPQRGNYLGLRQREDTDQRKRDREGNRDGKKRSRRKEQKDKERCWTLIALYFSAFYSLICFTLSLLWVLLTFSKF